MLDALARVWVLPLWTGPVDPKPMLGGLSNQSYYVEDGGRKFVVRFGRDYPFHHVFRARELMTAKAAHAAGFAPRVAHSGPGVQVAEFIDGKTFSGEDVRANIRAVVELIRRFHVEMPYHVSGPAFYFSVFHVIRDYARTLRAGDSRMRDVLPAWLVLSDRLEATQPPLPLIFSHNDLLPANIMDDGERLWLIDFEYSGFSTAMFDLAGLASNSGFSEAESDELLALYFGAKPSPEMRRAHYAMQCASLLRETMWSLVSEIHLDNPGVDYVTYTQQNLDRLAAALDRYQSTFGRVMP